MSAMPSPGTLPPRVGTILSVVAFAAVMSAGGCGDAGPPVELAIVNANVVPMDTERVLENQTILIDSGRIVAIGPAGEVNAGGAAEVVDAHGGYIVPGLADMHVHVWSRQDLVPHIANGVTLVRNMWGQPALLDMRARVAAGEILGPTIVTAGPIVDGDPPIWDGSDVAATPGDGRRIVAAQKAAGYDFIKVYNRVPADALEAIVEEARAQGIPVAGHVPDAVTLERALELDFATIEHLTGFATATLAEGRSQPSDWAGRIAMARSIESGELELSDLFDPARVAAVAGLAAQSETWQVPTLIVNNRIFTSRRQARELLQRPGVRYMPPAALASWNPDTDFRLQGVADDDLEAMQLLFGALLDRVAALHQAGVRILAGTDAPNPHVLHGYSIHEELALLHQAGLSNYETLVTATRGPAEFLGTPAEFGTVEVGRRADLVLARGNPLDDLSALVSPAGVVLRGDWLPRDELDAALEEVAASYATPADWFAGLELNATANAGSTVEYRIRFNDAEIGAARTVTGIISDTASVVTAQSVFAAGERTVNDCAIRYRPDGTFTTARCTLTDARGQHSFEVAVVDGNVVLNGTNAEGDDISSTIPADGSPLVVLGTMAPGLGSIVTRFASLAVGQSAGATVFALDTQSGELRFVKEAWTIERAPDRDGRVVLIGNATGALGNYDLEIEAGGATLERAVLTYQMGVMSIAR